MAISSSSHDRAGWRWTTSEAGCSIVATCDASRPTVLADTTILSMSSVSMSSTYELTRRAGSMRSAPAGDRSTVRRTSVWLHAWQRHPQRPHEPRQSRRALVRQRDLVRRRPHHSRVEPRPLIRDFSRVSDPVVAYRRQWQSHCHIQIRATVAENPRTRIGRIGRASSALSSSSTTKSVAWSTLRSGTTITNR